MMRSTIVVLLAFVGGSALCQEMLQNPGFELGPSEGTPQGWHRYGGSTAESQLRFNEQARSGQRCLQLTDTGPEERDNRWAVGVSQTMPVQAGAAYAASVWARCLARNNPTAMNLQLTFKPSGKTFVTRLTPAIGGDWRKFSVFGRAPDADTSVILYVYSMHYWTCDYLIDDVSLRQVSPEEYGDLLPLAQYGGVGLDKLRALNLETPIIADGRPAAVICIPVGAQWAAAADRLNEALKLKSGAELPVTTDARSLLDSEQTIIAVGNMVNNFVTERLHWNKYLVADSLTPGPGKYVLRTVHEPFNFRPKVNVLTVEASDGAGAMAGVAALGELLPQGQQIGFDEPLLVNPNFKPMASAQEEALLAEPLGQDGWRDFWRYAEMYRDRGDPAYARKAAGLLRALWDRYVGRPEYAVTWPEETTSNRVGAAWDMLEECPALSEEDRLTACRALLTLCYELPRHVSGWGRQSDNDTITWNHTTFPILGIYWIARYFERWYGDVDGKISYAMDEVRGCFRGQKGCWKPQCDADGYLTIVPRHLMEYTLAENDYEWFESGLCRQYAEYLTALSDNRGVLPGLGDSGYSRTPGYELNGLPMALWYYKDGRYLWRLKQVMGDSWQSSYDQTVRPRKWYSMAGLSVTRLHPEVYNFTKTRSYYGEGVFAPNVPPQKAFDKVTFRENLEPDGEYMLLDGYSRGKHLHYDGNAIIKLNADGEDWLIDGDYLVRNTTEHNMVSVIKNGRCDELMPVCASLENHADLQDAAFTRTKVSEYNGADWTRHIAWLKGEFFLVIDQCEALQDADYTFETVWKTLDRGEQSLSEGRVFETRVTTSGGVGSRGLVTVRRPAQDVAAAVRFAQKLSRLDFGLELPKGDYLLDVSAKGADTGSDSFWLSVDGGEQVGVHIPVGKFGPASRTATKEGAAANVKITADGAHVFSLTLREGAGPLLDKVSVLTPDGRMVAQFEAEDAPKIPSELANPAPDARFFVKSDGAARSKCSTRINNVGLQIRKLHQRFGGALKAGQRASVINLLYNDTTDAPKDYDVRRLGLSSALILKGDKPFGVFSADLGELSIEGLNTDAAALMVAGARLYAVDGTHMGIEGVRVADPVSVRFNIDYGYGIVRSDRDTKAYLPDGQEYDLWQGYMDVDATTLGDFSALKLLKLLPVAAAAGAAPPGQVAGPPTQAKGLLVQWRAPAVEQDGETALVRKLLPADLDGDGTHELLALRGRSVVCLGDAGKPLWEFEAGGVLRAITVADLEQDGNHEVLFGGDDEQLYITDATGKQLKVHAMTTPLRVGRSSVRQPRVSSICVGDIDLDGFNDIIVGTKNGNIARFDLDLNKLWAFDQVEHGTRDMVLVDLTGDAGLEIVAENKYGAVEVVDADGKAMRGVHSELGDVEMAIGDLDGDGKLEIANGSSTGAFTCETYGGPRLFEFPNYGYGVNDVAIAKLGPGGDSHVVIASETGYVYALDQDGGVTASTDLGDGATMLALCGDAAPELIAVGCRDGLLYCLDARLRPVRQISCGWPVDQVSATRGPQGQALIFASGQGSIAAIALK